MRRFFSGTLLSRLTGLGREVAMAAAFGTLPQVAAFWMAYRFAHLLRRVLGEGGLHIAFVPHFEGLRSEDPAQAALFFSQLSRRLTALLVGLVVVLEGILGWALLSEPAPGTAQVLELTMIFLPALIFISLYSLNNALLSCQQIFFLPNAAPACLNLIWMAGIWVLYSSPLEQALRHLAMMIVFAFAMQWVVTLPQVYQFLKAHLPEQRGKVALLPLLKPFALTLIGVTAVQINSALDALFARVADPEGPALLWYALRLQQLPLALVGVGLSRALLPPMTRAFQIGDLPRYRHFLQFALKRACALLIPVTGAVIVVGFSAVNLLYGRGAFETSSAIGTTTALWAYGLGLLPTTFVLILAAAFSARKNFAVPSLLSLGSVGLNVALNALFVYGLGMGALSVALATSMAAVANAGGLLIWLTKKEGSPGHISWMGPMVCTLFAGGCTLLLSQVWGDPTLPFLLGKSIQLSTGLSAQFVGCLLQALTYGGLYYAAALIPLPAKNALNG